MKKMIMILVFSVMLFSCDNALMDAYNDRWESYATSESGFYTATNVGDIATVTIGGMRVNMSYANNLESITFPFSPAYQDPVDSSTTTLTKKFFMGQTEVTNELFRKVLQWAYNNGKFSTNVNDHNGLDSTTAKYGSQQLLDLDNEQIKISYSGGIFTVDSGYKNHPVVFVSWYGTIMFCNWLTEMRDGNTTNVVYTGIDTTWVDTDTVENADRTGYRLPSSMEWEYAARYIGTTVPTQGNLPTEYVAQSHNSGHATLTAGYYWTPASYASGAIKNYTNQTETRAVGWYSDVFSVLMAVAQKSANQLGLYDMSGNVWEWCFSPGVTGGVDRGGSYLVSAKSIQVGYWNNNSPTTEYGDLGFRIARTKE